MRVRDAASTPAGVQLKVAERRGNCHLLAQSMSPEPRSICIIMRGQERIKVGTGGQVELGLNRPEFAGGSNS